MSSPRLPQGRNCRRRAGPQSGEGESADRGLAKPAASFAGFEPGRVVLEHLCNLKREKGAIREGRVVARTRAGAVIVRGDRPVGPVDFAAQNLVYDIACEASIMGAIPQAIVRPQAPTHQSKIRARSSPCVQRPFRRMIQDHTGLRIAPDADAA